MECRGEIARTICFYLPPTNSPQYPQIALHESEYLAPGRRVMRTSWTSWRCAAQRCWQDESRLSNLDAVLDILVILVRAVPLWRSVLKRNLLEEKKLTAASGTATFQGRSLKSHPERLLLFVFNVHYHDGQRTHLNMLDSSLHVTEKPWLWWPTTSLNLLAAPFH